MKVQDGSGSGYVAKVDSSNRLHTAARSQVSEESAAEIGDSYIAHGRCHLSADSSGGFMSMKNTSSTKVMKITRIYIDAHNLSDSLIIGQVKNPTVANGTLVDPVNKNFASGNVSGVELYISDSSSDLTITGGDPYHAFAIASLQHMVRDMKGTNVIYAGDIIAWTWETVDGGNAIDGEIVSLSVNYIMENI